MTGNRAVLGGPSGFSTPAGYLFVVEDNTAAGRPDTFGELVTLPDAPSSCPADLDVPRSVATSGDLVVHDAQPPLPTSKDRCQGGGWRNFGTTFKNQGACVAFVEQESRQECLFIRAVRGLPAFRAMYGRGLDELHAMRRCVRQRSES